MKLKHIIVVLLLAVVVGAVIQITKQGGEDYSNLPKGEAIDIVADFFSDWLDAEQSTTTNPTEAGLLDAPVLSADARAYLETEQRADYYPAFCQSVVPTRIGTKQVFETETEAQYMVVSRGADKANRTLVSLEKKGEGWQIVGIECSNGEQAPEREYTFEREGYLLKSVPPPLDSNYWHLVYKIDGVDGHTAQLFFDESSACVDLDGTRTVCNPDDLRDATKVMLKGQMLEAGAQVAVIEFVQE